MLGMFYRLLGKKFVVDLHDLSPELYQAQKNGKANRHVMRALYFFERLASRHAHVLIATNESQHAIQIDRCDAVSQNAYVVRNGPTNFSILMSIL